MVISYPPTRHDDVVDDYHGTRVEDPYRWLEDMEHPDTQGWVAAQNEITEAFLSEVPAREEIRARLNALWDYPRFDVPFERGERWFQTRNSGLQDQPVLYVSSAPLEEGRVLLDPNDLSIDGTVSVSALAVSDDGSLLAYATSIGGSDWRQWRVRDVASGIDRDDTIDWSKFTSAAWRGDGSGFYYGVLPQPEPGRELDQENRSVRILFHRLGSAQTDDVPVFSAPDQPDWLPDVALSDDDRYLVVTITRGTNPETQVEVLDLDDPASGFCTLVRGFEAKSIMVGNDESTFYLLTTAGADRGRIVAATLDNADPRRWQEVVGKSAGTLVEAHLYGGKLVLHYLRDAQSSLSVFERDGSHLRDIPLPDCASVAGSGYEQPGIEGRFGSDLIHFRVTTFTESGALWSHDLRRGVTAVVQPSTAAVDPAEFVTEQVFATSEDGTSIPVFITHRTDVSPTGDIPVVLYGYGGFNIPLTPSFSLPMMVWLERGGALAVANLRGGGEYGREWYDGGRLANKQQVFDDFRSCASWLCKSGWTNPRRTGIYGGSNGGLLVGASLTQHPELFGAAVSDVGVFDMLRFHRFTIGWAWTSDYGNPEIPEQFGWLQAYSPLHNVKPGTCYPPTMLLTGDHDDRVVPGHSFKFAAALQAAQGCERPILLRVGTAAGHGHGKPVSTQIAEKTDLLAFLDAALR
jgi:prolyl oligopeptidase